MRRCHPQPISVCTMQAPARNLADMRNDDLRRLQRHYPQPLSPEASDLLRIGDALGLDLQSPAKLGDKIVADLDTRVYGIGWWQAYPDIDRQTRILLSDYLVACARAVPDNLIEAQVERLELDHAVEDFGKWITRGIQPGRRFKHKPPRSPYEELGYRRVQTHLTGMVRAWGSALDCVAGCIVGVGGLPTDLVRTDMAPAWKALVKEAATDPVLAKLRDDLEQAETDAGPSGWRDWILGMRNTVVHRGRRTVVWGASVDRAGLDGFTLHLPVSPELTDIDGALRAGGQIAASYQASASEILDRLSQTMGSYISDATALLTDLWQARRADPALLKQSPKQWKRPSGLISPVPVFRGFSDLTQPTIAPTSLDLGSEAYLRLSAAGLTHLRASDAVPDPRVWNQS